MGATTITQEQIQDHFDTLGYSSKYLKDIEIEHLEQDRQEIWLNIFEKDKRQWVYRKRSIKTRIETFLKEM